MQQKEQVKKSQNEDKKDIKIKKSKAKVTKITATSRMAVKIRESYYTIEFTEERSLPGVTKKDQLDFEKEEIFKSVNETVDAQIKEIVNGFKK